MKKVRIQSFNKRNKTQIGSSSPAKWKQQLHDFNSWISGSSSRSEIRVRTGGRTPMEASCSSRSLLQKRTWSPHPSLLIEVRKRRIPVAVLSLQTSSLDLLLLLLLDFLYSADLSRSQTDHADLQEEKTDRFVFLVLITGSILDPVLERQHHQTSKSLTSSAETSFLQASKATSCF